MMGALSGLKVVELGEFITAPYCTKLLGDLGAEVIKIERPDGGDKARHYGPFLDNVPHPEKSGLFLNLNTNKLGATLNVQTATGRKLLQGLLKQADIFVESNPPAQMHDRGLDYDSVKKVNPRLLMTSITPFGQTGPYRDYKAHDITCSAAGGVTSITGRPTREPLTPPSFQGDHQAAISAAAATLAGVLTRDVGVQGQHIDISEAETLATTFVGNRVVTLLAEGLSRGRTGHRTFGAYPDTLLRCQDGHICLDCPQIVQWVRFLELLGTPEWTKNPRYRNRRAMAAEYPDESDSLLAPWLMTHSKKEIFSLCQERRVPMAPVNTAEEVVNDPHMEVREFFAEVAHPQAGSLRYPGAPYKFCGSPWLIRRPAPTLGQHNEEIYCARLGYSRHDLVQLKRAGVI